MKCTRVNINVSLNDDPKSQMDQVSVQLEIYAQEMRFPSDNWHACLRSSSRQPRILDGTVETGADILTSGDIAGNNILGGCVI